MAPHGFAPAYVWLTPAYACVQLHEIILEMIELKDMGGKREVRSRRSWNNATPSANYMALLMTVTRLAWIAHKRMTGRQSGRAIAHLPPQRGKPNKLLEFLDRLVAASRAGGATGERVPSPETGGTGDVGGISATRGGDGAAASAVHGAIEAELAQLDSEGLMLQVRAQFRKSESVSVCCRGPQAVARA